MTATIAWFIAMTGVLSVVRAIWLFDLLVRWQYENLHEQWERGGKPHGIFWSSNESIGRLSEVANQRLNFAWLFKIPEWVARFPECRRWLSHYRIAVMTANLCVLGEVYVLIR
jgi:hypothetical protein